MPWAFMFAEKCLLARPLMMRFCSDCILFVPRFELNSSSPDDGMVRLSMVESFLKLIRIPYVTSACI